MDRRPQPHDLPSPPAAGATPLRIAQVVVTNAFAGTERYVCDVSRELFARGHEVCVVGGSEDLMPAMLQGVPWLPGGTTARAVRSLASIGRRDVVHGHLPKGDFAAFFAAPFNAGRRYSTWHIALARGYRPAAQRFGKLAARAMSAEFAVSRYLAGRVDARIARVLVNGVPDQDVLVDTAANRHVLVAQRLEAEKDLETGLRAWALSGLGERGWRLRVAGHGPDRAALESLARDLGVQASVDFLGWVADIPGEMQQAAILLATMGAEGLGLTVLEAMSRGVPVVAAGGGGHLETVGLLPDPALFPPGDAHACSRQLLRLADDATLRIAYGQTLQRLQRGRFSLAHHVDQLEREYISRHRLR